MIVKRKIGHQFGDPEISARVQSLRLGTLGLDQKQFAALVGVKQPIISQWESGKHRPSAWALMKLGDISVNDRVWWYQQAGPEHAARLKAEGHVAPAPSKRDSPIDRELLIAVLEAIREELKRRKTEISSQRYAELVVALYEDGSENGRLDATKVTLLAKTA